MRLRRSITISVGCVVGFLSLPGLAAASPDGDAVLASSTQTIGSGSQVAITPMCPTGTRALGGGVHPLAPASLDNSNIYRVGFSAPVDETGTTAATDAGDIPRGWTVEVYNGGSPA